jgi:hypothetical protein
LPRALSYSFASAFQNVTLDELLPDFTLTNQTFTDAEATINSDIQDATFGASLLSPLETWIVSVLANTLASYFDPTGLVITLRQQAWDAAFNVSDNVLLDSDGSVLAPQPVIDHSSLQNAGQNACSVAPVSKQGVAR